MRRDRYSGKSQRESKLFFCLIDTHRGWDAPDRWDATKIWLLMNCDKKTEENFDDKLNRSIILKRNVKIKNIRLLQSGKSQAAVMTLVSISTSKERAC